MNGGARQAKRSIGELILFFLSGCWSCVFDTNLGSRSAKKKKIKLIVPAAVVDALFFLLPGRVGHLCTLLTTH